MSKRTEKTKFTSEEAFDIVMMRDSNFLDEDKPEEESDLSEFDTVEEDAIIRGVALFLDE